jgi:hypothetical protein
MAKKSRKARAKFRTIQENNNTERRPPVSINAGTVSQIRASASGGSVALQASRHQHVVPELIRISIIAGILFVIIIILSFIIT